MSTRRILGLIPARGGSKGLPGKNVRPLCGTPLISWTVAAALESGALDRVVVSTDDDEIASAATAAGAELLRRPDELATDVAPMLGVVLHALAEVPTGVGPYTHVMLLQPTSPLRTAEDITSAIARLEETGGEAIVSVCEAEHSPLLSNILPPDGSLKGFLRSDVARAPRQALDRYYRLNGAIYLASVPFLESHESFIGEGAFAYVMPAERSVDIDSELDFTIAEALLRKRSC